MRPAWATTPRRAHRHINPESGPHLQRRRLRNRQPAAFRVFASLDGADERHLSVGSQPMSRSVQLAVGRLAIIEPLRGLIEVGGSVSVRRWGCAGGAPVALGWDRADHPPAVGDETAAA